MFKTTQRYTSQQAKLARTNQCGGGGSGDDENGVTKTINNHILFAKTH